MGHFIIIRIPQPRERDSRSAAFGWLALVRGLGLLLAGAVLGASYDHSITLVAWIIVTANAAALAGLGWLLNGMPPTPSRRLT